MAISSRLAMASAGALVALLGGAGSLALISHKPAPTPVASDGRRLTLEMGRADTRADASKPVRCFVDGKNAGELSIAACAARNGVDAKALDLGLDRSGVLSAGEDDGSLTPLPPAAREQVEAPRLQPPAVALDDAADGDDGGLRAQPVALAPCLDYDGGWRSVGQAVPLGVCVRRLFDGRCQRPGGARYGRWADRTVRLVPGAVEISSDNRHFGPLALQGEGCSLPPA